MVGPVSNPHSNRESVDGVESLCCPVKAPKHNSSWEGLHERMDQNSSYRVSKLIEDQHMMSLSDY